jgi:hypothetical protein
VPVAVEDNAIGPSVFGRVSNSDLLLAISIFNEPLSTSYLNLQKYLYILSIYMKM